MNLIQKRFLTLVALVALAWGALYLLHWQDITRITQVEDADLEARILTTLDPDTVASLTFETPTGKVTVAREKRGAALEWVVTEPVSMGADALVIGGLVAHLTRARRTSLVGARTPNEQGEESVTPPKELTLYGLDTPRYRLTVKTADGDSETLLVGATNTFNGELFAKIADNPPVMMVPATVEYQVNKSLYDLRGKRLVSLSGDSVVKLEVEYGDKLQYVVERAGDTSFNLTHPMHFEASREKVEAVLATLGNLQAKEFVTEAGDPQSRARYGLDAPALRVTLTRASGEPITVLYSRQKSEGKERHYATLGGSSPIIRLQTPSLYQQVAYKPQALKDERVFRFDRAEVARVNLRSPEGEITLVREPESLNWEMTSPAKRDIRDSQVAGVFYILESMRVESVSDEVSAGEVFGEELLGTRGLGEESPEVLLFDAEGTLLGAIRFGVIVAPQRFVSETRSGQIVLVASERLESLPWSVDTFQDATSELN